VKDGKHKKGGKKSGGPVKKYDLFRARFLREKSGSQPRRKREKKSKGKGNKRPAPKACITQLDGGLHRGGKEKGSSKKSGKTDKPSAAELLRPTPSKKKRRPPKRSNPRTTPGKKKREKGDVESPDQQKEEGGEDKMGKRKRRDLLEWSGGRPCSWDSECRGEGGGNGAKLKRRDKKRWPGGERKPGERPVSVRSKKKED